MNINYERVERVVQYVFDNAKRGDAESVIRTVDTFPDSMMNLGEEKGLATESIIARTKPKILVELGGYFGYSAIRLAYAARKHDPEAHFYSVEFNPVLACVIEALARYAGLGDAITVLPGNLKKATPALRKAIKERFNTNSIDFLLLDHMKEEYVSDLQLAHKEGFFHKGTVIVADNILNPGAPEYQKYMETETSLYSTTIQHFSHDAILISYVN